MMGFKFTRGASRVLDYCYKTTHIRYLRVEQKKLPNVNTKRNICHFCRLKERNRKESTLHSPSRRIVPSIFHRHISGAKEDSDTVDQNNNNDEDDIIEDSNIRSLIEDQYILPVDGHTVFVIQPDMKLPWKKKQNTNANLQLEEACALIDSLPMWKVADKAIYSLKHINKLTLYNMGNFEEIVSRVHQLRQRSSVSAVFISIDMLSGLQLSNIQKAFKLPVYDRYTIVLQIFKIRAQTKEAKMQVALAELPYLRSRLVGIHKGTLDQQKGTLGAVRGMGETSLEVKQRIIHEREIRLKRDLTKLKENRELLKKDRKRYEIPTVAIVGYTNSGKTSLIKAFTGSADIIPMDKLFATLDVTVHAGLLPSRTKALFVDTVGFISDIPTELIASFTATLHDMLTADVIVHVRDISHPDQIAQQENVMETLNRLNLPESLREKIIEVGNKVDKLPKGAIMPAGCLPISATKGIGLDLLRQQIEDVVVSTTGRVKKKLKVSQSGPLLGWLHKEATVESMDMDPEAPEHLVVTAIFTGAQWGRFQSQFVSKKKQLKKR